MTTTMIASSSETAGDHQDQDNLLLSSLQVASQAWLNFDWNNRKLSWDKTKDECKELKEQSLSARKHLAETTKVFKRSVKSTEQASISLSKNNPEPSRTPEISTTIKCIDGLSKDCKKTIKSYQEEIDNLTKRCKVSDSAFTSLYHGLQELPDPTSLLGTSMNLIQGQKNHTTQLLNTLDKVNREMSEMEDHFITTQNKHQDEINTLNKELKKKDDQLLNASSSSSNNEELIQLRREVSEYEVEFRSLKNQDITIRKLETKILELQESSQEQLQEQLEKIKIELEETEGRKAAEALEREAAMERKVQTLELQLKSERAGREATQTHLLEADEIGGEREAAWEAQRQILIDDAARLRETLHETTRERDNLRLRLSALGGDESSKSPRSGSGSGGNTVLLAPSPASGGQTQQQQISDMILERKAYEAEVSELSQAANIFREDIRQKDEQILQERQSSQKMINLLEKEKITLQQQVSSLNTQLSLAPTQSLVDSMKRELNILKKLEYNVDDDVDDERDPEMTTTTGGGGGTNNENDLESVLLSKMRRLEADIVRERTKKNDLSKEVDVLKSKLITSDKAKNDAELLVMNLESDLQTAIVAAANNNVVNSPGGVPNSSSSSKKIVTVLPTVTSEDPDTLQRILDPDNTTSQQQQSSSLSDTTTNKEQDGTSSTVLPPPPLTTTTTMTSSSTATSAAAAAAASTMSAAEKANDDHSVATIIMAQRDRLRAKCDSIEAERDSFKRELQMQVQTAESLKADNTKLYEKVKYLQNYSSTRVGGGAGAGAYGRSNSGVDRDLDLEALEQRYEASVDPFRQFGRAERQRKFQQMSPMERAVFVVAKTVLGTKQMRTGLFFYMVTLHVLVFFTTYQFSHTTCNHANYHLMQEELIHLPPNKPKFEHAYETTEQQQKIHKLLGTDSLAGVVNVNNNNTTTTTAAADEETAQDTTDAAAADNKVRKMKKNKRRGNND